MKNQSWSEKFKERKIGQTLFVYLGSAWVFIEALNFLIEKYSWEVGVLDTLIILVIFGLPAVVLYVWFDGKFTKKAILLQAINLVIAFSVIGYDYIKPGSIEPRQLRLIKFKDNQKKLAESIQSIVVLPFDNYTGNDEFEYYVAGMHSGLIGDLGKISALRVISKTSSRLFKGANMSIPEIASELNVDAVIEASVSCVGGDSVCIQIRLVSAFPEEQQLWVQDYYEDKSQILNLYNRVTKQISEEINIILTPQEENLLADTKTVNTDAYDAYLKGMYYWDQLTRDGLQKSLEYFNISLEKDPDFAPAYAGIAQVWVGMMQMGFASPSIGIPKIYENLNKALELDPNYPESHFTNAVIAVWTEWNWEKGEKGFVKALELNPNDVMSHAYYAHLLMILLRSDEAYDQINIAMELDPLNPLIQGLYGVVLYYKGEYQSAISEAEKVLSVVPNHTLAWRVLCLSYHSMGNSRKSFDAYMQFSTLDNDTKLALESTFDNKGFLPAMKETIIALELASQTRFIQPVFVATVYIQINQFDKALEWLNKGYEMHDPDMPYIQCLDFYSQIKDEPGFIELVEKMNF